MLALIANETSVPLGEKPPPRGLGAGRTELAAGVCEVELERPVSVSM